MRKIEALKANKEHKKFITHANPKFHCLVAEIDNKPVGMIYYKKV